MLDSTKIKNTFTTYKFVILTLDSHAAGSMIRLQPRLRKVYPNLEITVHAAASWEEDPSSLKRAKEDLANADMVLITLIFLEDHISAILPDLKIARENCDAMLGLVSAKEIVNLTKIGSLDMSQPSTGIMGFLKRLRGNKNKVTGGEKEMAMLRQIPRILRFIPGKAQDVRSYFLTMLYWLGGSDDNVESMVIYLCEKYGGIKPIGNKTIFGL